MELENFRFCRPIPISDMSLFRDFNALYMYAKLSGAALDIVTVHLRPTHKQILFTYSVVYLLCRVIY